MKECVMRYLLPTEGNLSISVLSTALVLLLLTTPAHAQFAHFARDAALTPEDISLAKDAAKSLYTKSGVKLGETRVWANEASGASGIVEVVAVEDAGKCVVLRHLASTRKKPEIRYYLRRCRDSIGNWILSAN